LAPAPAGFFATGFPAVFFGGPLPDAAGVGFLMTAPGFFCAASAGLAVVSFTSFATAALGLAGPEDLPQTKAFSQHSLIFAIFMASKSGRKGMITFSPMTFIAVPKVSAELSRTPGSSDEKKKFFKL
jgi:hypothetical protein